MEWFNGELACLCCCCRWVAEIRAASVRMVTTKERGCGSHFHSVLVDRWNVKVLELVTEFNYILMLIIGWISFRLLHRM